MAMIIFNQRYKGRLARVVTAAKAREIQASLDNPPKDLTDEQSEFLLAIKHVYHSKPSHIHKTAQKASTRLISDENNLTNQGRLQGKSEMLPTGDR